MVNRKGLKALGSDSPEEIIGKTLRIEREALGYIPAFAVATPAALSSCNDGSGISLTKRASTGGFSPVPG